MKVQVPLSTIPTDELIEELINRVSDSLKDPEPQFDYFLSVFDDDERTIFGSRILGMQDRFLERVKKQ